MLLTLNLASNKPVHRIWQEYLWYPVLLFGLLNGGAFPRTLTIEGLSSGEQMAASLFLNIGIAIGILIGYLLMHEFRQVLLVVKGAKKTEILPGWIGYLAGIAGFGLLLYQASALLSVPNVLPGIPFRYYILPIILGFWFWRLYWEDRLWILLSFVVVLGIGIIPGLVAIALPLDSVLVLGSIFLFSIPFIFNWQFSQKISLICAVLAVFFQGWSMGFFVRENMTLAIANTIGAVLVVSFLFFISRIFIKEKFSDIVPGQLRIAAGIAMGLAIWWRFEEYQTWFDSKIVTEWALGILNLPVLSAILLLAAILTWPKKRIILEKLQVNVRKPVSHWIYLSFAFFLIPIGTIQLENPLFTPRPLAEGEAKRVLQQVLSNTFHAFNIPDEQKLYDQLAQNVSGELITDIYLDSRRRLNAGVRTGGEVTVREVKVLSARQVGEDADAVRGFSYESKWAVTARVRHLQHVHHRQNIYNGIIRIKIDERSWKIAAIELLSEDRVIIPGSAG
jgi:hypothetical protein